MGLLKFESEPEFGKLAEYVSACQPCGALEAEGYCAPEKRLFREYTGFTVDFLYASVQLDDKKIFEDYVLWFYELLCPVMADMPKHRVRALLLSHFSVVENGAEQIFAGAGLKKLKSFIGYGKRAAADAEVTGKSPEPLRYGKYEKERQRYLDALMRSDTKSAVAVAAEFLQTGIPVEDILVEILGETMRGGRAMAQPSDFRGHGTLLYIHHPACVSAAVSCYFSAEAEEEKGTGSMRGK